MPVTLPKLRLDGAVVKKTKKKKRTWETNPLKQDRILNTLLNDVDLVQKKKGFHRWKTQFLGRMKELFYNEECNNAAALAYIEFSRNTDALVQSIEEIISYINENSNTNSASFNSSPPSSYRRQSVKETKSLHEVKRSFRLVIEDLKALIPITSKEEKKKGYNKYNMIGLLVESDFQQYAKLNICRDVFRSLRIKILNTSADRQILRTIDRFEESMDRFVSFMREIEVSHVMDYCLKVKPSEIPEVLLQQLDSNSSGYVVAATKTKKDDEDTSSSCFSSVAGVPSNYRTNQIFSPPNFDNNSSYHQQSNFNIIDNNNNNVETKCEESDDDESVNTMLQAFKQTKISYVKIDVEANGKGLVLMDKKQKSKTSGGDKSGVSITPNNKNKTRPSKSVTVKKGKQGSKGYRKSDPDGVVSQGFEGDSFKPKKGPNSRLRRTKSGQDRQRSISNFLAEEIKKDEQKAALLRISNTVIPLNEVPTITTTDISDQRCGMGDYKNVAVKYNLDNEALTDEDEDSTSMQEDNKDDSEMATLSQPRRRKNNTFTTPKRWKRSIYASLPSQQQMPSLLGQDDGECSSSSVADVLLPSNDATFGTQTPAFEFDFKPVSEWSSVASADSMDSDATDHPLGKKLREKKSRKVKRDLKNKKRRSVKKTSSKTMKHLLLE